MPQYLAPDVYVEEVDTGSKPIEGVSTSIAGIVGVTERGPLNVPILVTSNGEFNYWFGGVLDPEDFQSHCFLPHAAEGFFTNGGKQLYVTRVLDTTLAAAASLELSDRTAPMPFISTLLLRAAPEATGTAANPPPLVVLPDANLGVNKWLRIGDGSSAEYRQIAVAPKPETMLIPLHLPLGHSHDDGEFAHQLDRVPLNSPIALTADVSAGAQTLDIDGATADIAALAKGVLVEVGGTTGEYRFVTSIANVAFSSPTNQSARIALDAPVQLPYAKTTAKVQQLVASASIATGGPIALTAPANPGDTVIHVDASIADITPLAGGVLLEVKDGANTEYRTITAVTAPVPSTPGHETVDVTLGSPLTLAYAKATTVVQRFAPAAGAPQATVRPAVRAGDSLLYVDNRGGNFKDRSKLVLLDGGLTAIPEVRRIGELFQLTVASPVEADYDAGSLVRIVNLGDDGRVTLGGAGALAGAGNIPVTDMRPFHAGQQIVLGTAGGPYEIQTVAGVTVTASPAGTLALVGTLATNKLASDLVIEWRMLTAAARTGLAFLTLNDRSGLAVGDVMHLVDGANEAFAEIAMLPLPAPPGVWPDAGNVVLSTPLLFDFSTATQVIRQNPAVPDAAFQASTLALTAAADATTLMVSDANGWALNRYIEVQTLESSYFHRIAAAPFGPIAPNPPVASDAAKLVTLTNPALVRSHPVGSAVIQRQPLFEVAALDPGAWGDRLRIAIEDEDSGLVASTRFLSVTNATRARVASVSGMEPGSVLELLQADGSVLGAPVKVATVNRGSCEVTFDAANPLSAAQMGAAPNLTIRSREFRLLVFYYNVPDPSAPTRAEPPLPVEVFRNLSMDVRHSRYFQAVIGEINGTPVRRSDHRPEGSSWFIRVEDTATTPAALQSLRLGPEALVDTLPNGGTRPARHELSGGDDSILTLKDDNYVGADAADPEKRTGLFTLLNVEDISIVAAPGCTSADIQRALIEQCENNRFRFAVLDGPSPPKDTITDVQTQRQQFDTKYAALYHPWLLISNPFPGTSGAPTDYVIPPAGHMLGVYARTDIERGVHKAPANEVVMGIVGLQRIVNKEQQEVLNPYPVNINVIRDFRNHSRGIRVYGGRVITSDSDWKYVNVRRLLIFIEASLNQGLQWVVFEPNAEPLWARVKRSVSNFLTLAWRNGALEGTKPEEAFFVKCDRTTMTQTDIDEGRLICLIGVAPVKPAEFVIVRIGLWTANANQ